jgi:hypothetical protein
MAGNYPDGVSQSDIDRAHDGGDEPPEESFNEQSGEDHLRHIMEEAKKLK